MAASNGQSRGCEMVDKQISFYFEFFPKKNILFFVNCILLFKSF